MSNIPPPIIDSARLMCFADTTSDVEFTDRISLHVTVNGVLERLGEVPRLAVCSEYGDLSEHLLMFCNSDWEVQGVIGYQSLDEALRHAERGYKGISTKWRSTPYTDDEVNDYLRNEYEVDPTSEWWLMRCSFCGKSSDEVEQIFKSARASICRDCVQQFHKSLTEASDA